MIGGCATAPAPATGPAVTPQAQASTARAEQVETLLRAGRSLAAEHKPVEAEVQLRRAIQLAWGFGAPWARYRADGFSALAQCLIEQKRIADARDAMDQALRLLKPGSLADDQLISDLEALRAESFRDEQNPTLAVAPFAAAIQAASRHPAELAPPLILLSLRLAETLQGLGRRQEATNTLDRALAVAKEHREQQGGAALARRVASALAALYDAAGEPARAQALLAEFGAAPERAPTVTVAVAASPAAPSNGSTSNAANTSNTAKEVAAMQADFRACYRKSLATNSDIEGKVELILQVAADGHVTNVKAQASSLPHYAVDCLVKRAALGRFDPPMGGATQFTLPVTFVKQEHEEF